MKVVHANPPNIDAIDAVFHVRGLAGVVFTFGDTIYVPGGEALSPMLLSHEGVHYSRQTNDPEKIAAWWHRYLVDAEFRYNEELPAHRAEYRQFCALETDRNARIKYLTTIAHRLAGPLYGGVVKPGEARRRIAA